LPAQRGYNAKTLERNFEIATHARAIMASYREVEAIVTQSGQPDDGTDTDRSFHSFNGTSNSMSQPPDMLTTAAAHYHAGHFHEAEKICRQTLQIDPLHDGALHLLGMIAHEAGRNDAAVVLIEQAIAIKPSAAAYHCNLGLVYQLAGNPTKARFAYSQALKLRPDYPEAHSNLGALLLDLNERHEAITSLREAIRLQPNLAAAQCNLGKALHLEGRMNEAISCLEQAARLQPRMTEAHYHLGNVLQEVGRIEEAIAAYQRALSLEPQNVDVFNNLANTLQRAGRSDEAVAAYEQALECRPNHFAAHANLGVLLKDQGKPDKAEQHLRAAIGIRPTGVLRILLATLLPPIYRSVDHLEECRQRLIQNLQELDKEPLRFDPAREVLPNLFYLAYQGYNDRDLHAALARLYRRGASAPGAQKRSGPGPVKVGILSRYLKNHTIGVLMRGLFAALPRDGLHVTALPVDCAADEVTEFIRSHADQNVPLPDNLAAARHTIEQLKLDVLFYADIGMDPLTYTLAFSRLAPVQCVTWGHPVTSGIPTIDYFISSELIEPPDASRHYTEKLVRLKTLPFYYYRPAAPITLKRRADFGLAEKDHIYGCLQTLFKFHPQFDVLLGDILRRDPRGQLVLIRGKYPHWDELLKQRFAATMPDVCQRITWLPPQPREDFLNLMRLADVLLDTIHFGGGNTSYEAFALGVPVVTLPASLTRGRITYALYKKMGVMDCVADTPADYCRRAVELGTNADYRQTVRERILAASDNLFEESQAAIELAGFFRDAVAAVR
jgi:predicted O-linked N-acetylglucosamine transferase (SPINDLY family)